MIRGSEVIDPCPISVAADMMVIVPSGAMLTHGLRALPAPSAASVAARAMPLRPSASAKEKPAAPTMTWRRDRDELEFSGATWRVMAQTSGTARESAHKMPFSPPVSRLRGEGQDDVRRRGR